MREQFIRTEMLLGAGTVGGGVILVLIGLKILLEGLGVL